MVPSSLRLEPEVVESANALDSSRFAQVAGRVAQGLQLGAAPFQQHELAELEMSLGMDPDALRRLIEALTVVFTQTAFSATESNSLREQLLESGLAEDKSEAVARVWQATSVQVIDSLKLRLAKPLQLDDVKWSLGAAISSKGQSELRTPHATLELDLKGATESQPLTIQFNHEQLLSLHDQLQQIQDKLDTLK